MADARRQPFTTIEDLELAVGGRERFVQLTDWDGDGEPDEAAVRSAQEKADGFISSYSNKRYRLDREHLPRLLVLYAAEEAMYAIAVRRGQVTQAESDEHDDRIKWLEALAAGKVAPSEPPPPKSSAVVDRYQPSERAVSREKMKGFW